MEADTALRILRDTAFKPGWTIMARYVGISTIYVQFLIDTVDTSKPSADGICRHRVEILPPGRAIDTRRIHSVEELMFEVLKLADVLDEHEDREFLQVRRPDGTWYAPLHPHTGQGIRDWVSYGGNPASNAA